MVSDYLLKVNKMTTQNTNAIDTKNLPENQKEACDIYIKTVSKLTALNKGANKRFMQGLGNCMVDMINTVPRTPIAYKYAIDGMRASLLQGTSYTIKQAGLLQSVLAFSLKLKSDDLEDLIEALRDATSLEKARLVLYTKGIWTSSNAIDLADKGLINKNQSTPKAVKRIPAIVKQKAPAIALSINPESIAPSVVKTRLKEIEADSKVRGIEIPESVIKSLKLVDEQKKAPAKVVGDSTATLKALELNAEQLLTLMKKKGIKDKTILAVANNILKGLTKVNELNTK